MILVCEAPRYSVSLIQAAAMKAAAHKGPPSTLSRPSYSGYGTEGMRKEWTFAVGSAEGSKTPPLRRSMFARQSPVSVDLS
jgi:hypothetical protein